MKAIEVQGDWGIDHLKAIEQPDPKPGPGQIVVAMKAASLNYRDLLMVTGKGGAKLPVIPFSDGAGDVIAVGSGVTRVSQGDRVCPIFFQSWIDGPVAAPKRVAALGGSVPGVLQEKMLLDAEGVTPFPAHLSYLEAATLPCAGLTAWRGLVNEAKVKPGDWVLVQGTGGVSIFALQLAKLMGCKVVVTSSSDEKLAHAKELGADHLINYKTDANWAKAALEATGGVDCVIEVGGAGTFNQSLEAAKVGGAIVVIGLLSGVAQQIFVPTIFGKNLHIHGISVGSREQFEAMNAFIAKHKLKPVVDQVYPWLKVQDALQAMKNAGHFGKICLEF
jgi:NADPH:quinone reductase-like Zn-dependent oxidoreductase